METIQVNLAQQPYSVYVGQHILDTFSTILMKHFPAKQIALITSRSIYQLHGTNIAEQLSREAQLLTLFVPDGESAKSFTQVQHLYTQLLKNKFERGSLIIALGGGVIGDLAGFVAATYLRGIAFVQVPTTLLAQVDSSIGGKTGINHKLGKNLIGAFKQPLFVFSDIHVLTTLSHDELRCGLGEVLKYGFILNSEFFHYFDLNFEKAQQMDLAVLSHLVKISAAEKASVVEKDEREKNLRMVLNFGHTFGHALEVEFKFSGIKHGEAVVLGMACALEYSRLADAINEDDYHRGMTLLKRFPIVYNRSQIDGKRLAKHMLLDKKVKNRQIRLILSPEIGRYSLEENADLALIEKAFKVLQ